MKEVPDLTVKERWGVLGILFTSPLEQQFIDGFMIRY